MQAYLDNRVRVWWRSAHLSGRRSDLRKKFTDRRTDRRTTDTTPLHQLIGMSFKKIGKKTLETVKAEITTKLRVRMNFYE